MSENTVTSNTLVSETAAQPTCLEVLVGAIAVGVCSALFLFWGLASEPHFADESAMIAQSYYYTLFKSGYSNHPDWLHYAAFDHPPLPKYCFGLFLDLAGLPVPTSIKPWENWIRGDFSPPGDSRILYWARVPSALFGAGGIVAIYLVGVQVHSRLVGVLAAMLLVVNPLYVRHARRAMSDSFTECLVMAAVAVGLWGLDRLWSDECRRRQWVVFVVSESVLCGLAVLAKLNGGLAFIIVAGMVVCGRLFARSAVSGKGALVALAAMAAVGAGSFVVFVALNPFLTARPQLPLATSAKTRELAEMGPLARARFLVQFRRDWTKDALGNTHFRKDWLPTLTDRARMTMWEGFGRFSPLGPRDIRTVKPRPELESFTEYRRASSLIWLPLVVWGVCLAARDAWRVGRSHGAGMPPAGGLLVYAAATSAFVVLLIPLNWDRYYLPIQPPAAVLVAYGIVRMRNR